jgi:hypothetical protein
MNKKIFLLLSASLMFFTTGCSVLRVPYLNKVLPKETVTKIVFQQNGKIDSLVDFAKQADALAKEKWATDAELKFIYIAYNKSFYTYQAVFKSKEKSLNAQLMGDLTIDYNYNVMLADSEAFPIKVHKTTPVNNNQLAGITCDKEEYCKMIVLNIDNLETIKVDDLKVVPAEIIKDDNIGFGADGFSYGQIKVKDGILRLDWGKYHVNMTTGAEIVSGAANSETQNSSLNNPATFTPAITTTTEKNTTSSQAAIDQNRDSDNDGLPDWQELKYGTNPNNPDTDGDGFKDGAEVAGGYNPLGSGKMTAAQLEIKNKIAGLTVPVIISKPATPIPVVKPATSNDAPNCAGIKSGTLKMDGGVSDKELIYCFYKVAGSNCGHFDLIFKTADLGDVKFSSNINGQMCVYRVDFGDAGQIQDSSKKYYANKFIQYSVVAEKAPSTISYESINPKEIYGSIDGIVAEYYSSQPGVSGNLEKKTLTEQQAMMTVAARDALRVADIKQIQTALELYYNDVKKYPDQVIFGSALKDPKGLITYMSAIPKNPLPNDGACPADFAFKYEVTAGDKVSSNNYKLTYCLGADFSNGAQKIPAGIHVATPSGINQR